MEQNKQDFNIWKYLPTWKESKWWVIIGALYSPLSYLTVFGFPPTREWLRENYYQVFQLPITPAGFIVYYLENVDRLMYGFSGREVFLIRSIIYAILTAFIGYTLCLLFKSLKNLFKLLLSR